MALPDDYPRPSRRPLLTVYWHILATIASWVLLAGFLLFTVALESHKEKEKLRANKLVMDVIALIMVVLPHFPAVALILMFKDRHDFLLNRIYVPYFGSSLLGTFNAALHVFCRGLMPLTRAGLAYIILASVSTAGYGIAAFHSHWKVHVAVSRRNKSPRLEPLSPEPQPDPDPLPADIPPIPYPPRPQQSPPPQQLQRWSRYFPGPNDPTSELTNETDRQLLRLLHSNTGHVTSRQLVRDTTFRIELPEEQSPSPNPRSAEAEAKISPSIQTAVSSSNLENK